ncbi:hypothetical protein Q5752_001183 [Cryptotrichosporon argae]
MLSNTPISPNSRRTSFVGHRRETDVDGSLIVDVVPDGNPNADAPSAAPVHSRRKPIRRALPSVPARAITPADSLTRQTDGELPTLNHLLSVGNGRVLCLAADERHVYAGCQSRDNEITVFSRASLQPMYRLIGHAGSVLALMVVPSRGWLVSSSSAGDVRIWSTSTLQPLFIIHPCDDTSGDIYSLAWDDRAGGTLYFGAQNTSIEWVNFASPQARPTGTALASSSAQATPDTSAVDLPSGARTPRSMRYKPHSFFHSMLPHDVKNGANVHRTLSSGAHPVGRRAESASPNAPQGEVTEIEIDVNDTVQAAHYGYVYALVTVPRSNGGVLLVSGSGDCDVKVWETREGGGLVLLREFQDLSGAVYSLVVRDALLFAGLQDGEIVVWDLETAARIRTIEAHETDVMTMSVLGGDVYTAAADGLVLRINDRFDCTAAFKAHTGIVLSSTIVPDQHGWHLITAGNDSFVKIWNVELPSSIGQKCAAPDVGVSAEGDVLLYALSKLIAIPTVSDEQHRESCRQGAHLLSKLLGQLGARSEVLSGEEGKNPLVLATFLGQDNDKPRKRVLFYGHYDVQPADPSFWDTDPWELSGRNGYLYGRGVTDNKGPILAVASAAAALRQRRELDVDLVMLIEGEEEAGSSGFAAAVRKNKDSIGPIDVVLLSNSTWIDEDDPCVVYGMRGVVYANLTVSSEGDDAHNGVEGGAVAEPMFDMVRVLSGMADAKGVKIPGFYDSVRPQTEEEMALLADVARASGRPLDELVAVWRQPSFSIANITTNGGNKTVIPRRVSADISMRIVPDQDLDTIVSSLKAYCQETFDALGSPNQFDIAVTHTASWWLASLDNPYFLALEAAVHAVWQRAPLKIREGGTVPTVFWLERELGAPCVHLPLGQASDAGHLANERIRLLNLRNGKRVVETYLQKVAQL